MRDAGRRMFLKTAVGGALAGVSGCIQRARNLVGRPTATQVSLSIKTMPADDDPYAIRVAQRLANRLRRVGIDVDVIPMRTDELLRDLLIRQEFELYVAEHPGGTDAEFLFPLLHSRYSEESGWNNPFGYTDLTTDELLEVERVQTGERRRESIAELQRTIARKQPFAVIAFPDQIGAVRSGRLRSWADGGLYNPMEFFSIQRMEAEERSSRPSTLRVMVTDDRMTKNLNPLAVAFRSHGYVTGLLYDPLIRRHDASPIPWLAESITWSGEEIPAKEIATVSLREGARWHDGRPLTAADVTFTYRFLADTALGNGAVPVPAPRFQGSISLVEELEPIDDTALRFRFATPNRRTAMRALTVPILPEHEWEPRSHPAQFADQTLAGETTEALVANNMDPIGSGPFRFDRAIADETLVLGRFDEHFLNRGEPETGNWFAEDGFDRIVFRVVPSDAAAIELIAAGEGDVTGSPLSANAVPTIGREPDLRLTVDRSRAFYHLGFNIRTAPLSNPHFRRSIAQLIDKASLVDDVFQGYAMPAASPLAGTDWLPPDLEWRGRDPVLPFVDEDGEFDVARARAAFERAGYQYSDDGRLLSQ